MTNWILSEEVSDEIHSLVANIVVMIINEIELKEQEEEEKPEDEMEAPCIH